MSYGMDELNRAILLSPLVRYQEFFRHTQPGLFAEFGVYQGTVITQLANIVTDPIYGFDSWEGLPENWTTLSGETYGGYKKGYFTSSIPTNLPSNVVLIKGWFQDTLPKFLEETPNLSMSFIHIDCDIYSSTKFVLDQLKDRLNGAVVVFDEIAQWNPLFHKNVPLYSTEAHEENEGRAFREFLAETGYKYICLGRPTDTGAAGFKLFK